ncbi:MAG: molecular chaperone TorD family protein [Acidimicrobiia bacterium]
MSSPELFRALAVVCEDATPDHVRIAEAVGLPPGSRAEHTETFILELPPYASVHLGAEGMLGGEAGDRVAGFWRAVGLMPPAEPDHLAALLGLYAALAQSDEMGHARRALLWEHVLPWVPAYLTKLSAIAPASYAAWGDLLADMLRAEAAAGRPDTGLPLHLREAPPPIDPEEGLDDFLAGLLAPIRSGMIITRTDLGLAANALGLGLRQGERRYALKALLSQDAAATLGFLAGVADAWIEEHERSEPWLGDISRFWCSRAKITAVRLREAAATAEAATAARIATSV